MKHLTAQTPVPTGGCTALRRTGEFCDGDSLPDAPFPICVVHAAEVLRYLNSVVTDGGAAVEAARAIEGEDVPSILIPDEDAPLVYYLRVGNHIKIGHSTNFTVRRRQYPPDAELLAVEFGDTALELQRHRQFRKDLARRREWFTPSPELMAHIKDLAEQAA